MVKKIVSTVTVNKYTLYLFVYKIFATVLKI